MSWLTDWETDRQTQQMIDSQNRYSQLTDLLLTGQQFDLFIDCWVAPDWQTKNNRQTDSFRINQQINLLSFVKGYRLKAERCNMFLIF